MAALNMLARSASGAPFKEKFPPLSPEGKGLLAAVVAMWVLATAWTGMRIISRNIRKSAYYAEDHLYFIGFALFNGLCITYVLAICVGGAGNDIGRLSEHHMYHYTRISIANQTMYAATLCFIKISLVAMIQRVFAASTSVTLRIASWVTIVVITCWALYTILLGFFICLPVGATWGAATPTSCGNQTVAYSAVAVIDIISEVMIVALPMRLLSGLHIARPHKIGLFLVFGAGIVTIVFSCVRLKYALNIDFDNVTKSFAVASVSSILQAGVALMVASSPILRPVFDRTILHWLGVSVRSTGRNTSSNPTGGPSASRHHASAGYHDASRISHHKGFRQMTDSEEHLAWELRDMQGKGGEQRTTIKAQTALSDNSSDRRSRAESLSNGQIIVTQETIVR
ncbi:hypothetical protein NCS57_01403200 [Fusarium keratoplasticum]|uniref:Uncharacterized protein n=1 Tax=Fusarium keratoplasticum TaxID=1328300 RepID=A0ACC0QG60_9HYPO|nr:hypothetical protein NCS57_01403200 [Fusarium keratoplasticum]KAI8650688.1 hypothetical protein NCS57_01403200 [Fusarium keratoplasticum]